MPVNTYTGINLGYCDCIFWHNAYHKIYYIFYISLCAMVVNTFGFIPVIRSENCNYQQALAIKPTKRIYLDSQIPFWKATIGQKYIIKTYFQLNFCNSDSHTWKQIPGNSSTEVVNLVLQTGLVIAAVLLYGAPYSSMRFNYYSYPGPLLLICFNLFD